LLFIIAHKAERRLVYVCEVLFRLILQVPYRIIPADRYFNDEEIKNLTQGPLIFYGVEPSQKSIYIPSSGLLSETGIRTELPETLLKNNQLYILPQKHEFQGFEFDLFSASFYVLTAYYFYQARVFDKHGRYLENSNFLVQNNYFSEPWVQVWALSLAEKMKELFPEFSYEKPEFDWRMTIDVDHPFAFLHKGWRGIAGFAKDIITLRFNNLYYRSRAFYHHTDPYETFSFICNELSPEKTVFFFLIWRESGYDGHFTSKNKHYQKIIKQLAGNGYQIGIHPSYLTFLSRQAIKVEKEILEEVTGEEVKKARQHFLRYRLPHTPEIYVNEGITDDFNALNATVPGFRFGMAIPFKWYNLKEDIMTSLTLQPEMVMDVTLQNYLRLDPVQAFNTIIRLIEKVRQYGGIFSMLWHNSSLAEIHGWQGYRKVFLDVVSYLKQQKPI